MPPRPRRARARPAAPPLRWTAVGIAVRLLLLPVGISTDTLAVYWRAHLIAFHGAVFDGYLVNMGAHGLHALWLVLVQPVLGAAEALWTHPWWWADPNALAQHHMEIFLARPDVLRAITLLKLPYVAAELAAGWLLWLLLRDSASEQARRRAWIFWMLSPAALYATLVFGRYEAFPVLAVVAALLLAERGRPLWAAVVLGAGMTLRAYPILLVPFFALTLYRGLPRQIAWSGLAVAPFAASMALNRLVGGNFGELAAVGDFNFGGNWFAFGLQPERGGPGLYWFVVIAGALALYLLGRDRGWWGSAPVPARDLWRWLVLAHLGMFAFSQFSAHYLMWLTPAIALLLGRTTRRGVTELHLVQVLASFAAIALLFGGALFTGVLGGLGETTRTLLPLGPVLPGAGGEQLADVLWSVFWVATLALGVPFGLATLREDPGARPAPQPEQPLAV